MWIQVLREQLREIFKDHRLPSEWWDRYAVVPLRRAYAREPNSIVESLDGPLGGRATVGLPTA